MTAADASTDRPRPGWLFGPLPDLLLGCGLAYAAVFAMLVVAGPAVREAVPLGALIVGTLFVGTPHYGATLMRVYELPEERRRYRLFAVWASALIAVLFVAGLHHGGLRSWIHTVYLTWSPWHYTAQNFGIAMMLLGRSGAALPPAGKRLVWVNFVASYALIFLAFHGDATPVNYAPGVVKPGGVHFVSLGIPFGPRNALMAAAGLVYVASLVGAARAMLQAGHWRRSFPAALLILTQALWFVFPAVSRATGSLQGVEPLSRQFAVYSFAWIAYGHSIQYLWVTAYFARQRAPQQSHLRFYAKALCAGAAIWGAPAILFMPSALGPLSHEGGLFLMIAACVNLHHFVLDGAVWKLRDGRVARVLLRSETRAPAATDATPRRHPLRATLLIAGAACAVVTAVANWEWHFGYLPALRRGDVERIVTAEERLRWTGQESPRLLTELGRLRMERGDSEGAQQALERSLALEPSARRWQQLGALHARNGRLPAAAEAYDAALRLAPHSAAALRRSGLLWLRLGDETKARRRLERVRDRYPDDRAVLDALERLDAPG